MAASVSQDDMRIEEQTLGRVSEACFERQLAEEKQKSQNLEAINARLTLQLSSEKATFILEKKQLLQRVAAEKTENEHLEQKIFRLAHELMAAERQIDELSKVDPMSSEIVDPFKSPKKTGFEYSLYRHAPFEYTVVPNPDLPAKPTCTDKRYVETLEQQLKLYQVLLELGNQTKGSHRIEARLKGSGLHKDSPRRTYVSPQYYHFVQSARQTPVADHLQPLDFELDNLVIRDRKEIF